MENINSFALRHIGLSQADIENLLKQLGYKDLEDFSKSVLPENIFTEEKLGLGDALSEEGSESLSPQIFRAGGLDRFLPKDVLIKCF